MEPDRQIIRAEVTGMCSGVKRALKIAESHTTDSGSSPVYTLGDLVHNDRVMQFLSEKGISSVRTAGEVESGTVIIRAHGATPDTIKTLEDRNITVIDATCPKVKRSHRFINEYRNRDYFVVIVGEEGHSEVTGLLSRSGVYALVETVADADAIDCHPNMVVLAQTTFSPVMYLEICNRLQARCPGLEVLQTICPAMQKRYDALIELSKKVEAILVVGGSKSANTRRLYELAIASDIPAWHIEGVGNIPSQIAGYRRIGLAAGASTPPWLLDEVEDYLKKGDLV